VEDTNINGHPVFPDFGPGPMEALDEFLLRNGDFESDLTREKFLVTFNPRGYLRRLRKSNE
jgi:cephalosporin hydroxylase